MDFSEEVNIQNIISIAKQAGKEVMKIYEKDFSIEYKEDNSPLTEADTASNKIIVNKLKELYPNIPILSEESKEIPYEERKNWDYFWLIDPLDGTKEFIKKNGEFTINIALIHKHIPILGIVYVPAKDTIYYAQENKGSFKQIDQNKPEKLQTKERSKDKIIIIASRSHSTKETDEFIESKKKECKEVEIIQAGSALKICLVAEGKADIYPRFVGSMEWDIAAGHAIINEVGKKIHKPNSDEELQYNKENLLNDWFIVE